MLLTSTRQSQSSDHMLCTVCPYRLVTYDLRFEGLPPCIKVHLDCLATYVKSFTCIKVHLDCLATYVAKSSINGKIYEWYLIDNLNYQAIPIKCRNMVSQRVSLIKQGHK